VRLYEQDPPEQRRLGELNHARLDLATARLARGHLDGFAKAVRTVHDTAKHRPIESVTRRLRQVDALLGQRGPSSTFCLAMPCSWPSTAPRR
jgi:hypothetical protein